MSDTIKPVAYLHTEPNGNQFFVELDDYESACDECHPLFTKAQLDAAVAAEREQCARIVESYTGAWDDKGYALAAAIRAARPAGEDAK